MEDELHPLITPLRVGKLGDEKGVQVSIRNKYRSKGVNVNITSRKTDSSVSPFLPDSKNMATSPLKFPRTHGTKRKLFPGNSDDVTPSSPSSVPSSDYEPDDSSESNWMSNESEEERRFKNKMRDCMLIAIAKEPKMFLGLPKKSYNVIEFLTDRIPISTLDILITLKKIKMNDSFSILGVHFGYAASSVSRIFAKALPLMAAKLKELIFFTPDKIYINLPISFRAR